MSLAVFCSFDTRSGVRRSGGGTKHNDEHERAARFDAPAQTAPDMLQTRALHYFYVATTPHNTPKMYARVQHVWLEGASRSEGLLESSGRAHAPDD